MVLVGNAEGAFVRVGSGRDMHYADSAYWYGETVPPPLGYVRSEMMITEALASLSGTVVFRFQRKATASFPLLPAATCERPCSDYAPCQMTTTVAIARDAPRHRERTAQLIAAKRSRPSATDDDSRTAWRKVYSIASNAVSEKVAGTPASTASGSFAADLPSTRSQRANRNRQLCGKRDEEANFAGQLSTGASFTARQLQRSDKCAIFGSSALRAERVWPDARPYSRLLRALALCAQTVGTCCDRYRAKSVGHLWK